MKNWQPLLGFVWLFLSWTAQGQTADQFAHNALRLQQEGKHQDAQQEWDKALLKDGKNPSFWIAKSQSCLMAKDTLKAIAVLQKGIQSNPQTSEIQWALAGIFEQQQKIMAALRLYQTAYLNEKESGKKILAATRCAELLTQTRQFAEALRITQEALKIDSTHRESMYWQGKIHNENAQYEQSVKVLKKATQKMIAGVNSAKYFYELGYALFQLERYKEAEFELRKADVGVFKPKVMEMTAQYFFLLADGYFKTYEFEKSQEALQWALKIDPAHRPATLLKKEIEKANFIDISSQKESLLEALQVYKEIDRKAGVYANLCKLAFQARQYAEAAQNADLYLAIKSQQNETNIWYYKAISLYKIGGNYDQAISIFKKILTTTLPEDEMTYRCYFALGMIASRMHELDLAKSYFQRSSRSFMKFPSKAEIKKIEQMRQLASLSR